MAEAESKPAPESESRHSARKPNPAEVLELARNSGDLPRLYANGFAIGMTNADFEVVLQLSGKPVAAIHLSYTLAKTLAQKLGRLVVELEGVIKQELQTTDSLEAALKADKEKKKTEVKAERVQ